MKRALDILAWAVLGTLLGAILFGAGYFTYRSPNFGVAFFGTLALAVVVGWAFDRTVGK